jgi:glycyl-tRNA synthetase beta chain
VVALSDKLETLVGLFGIGQAPTGDKDPFALRRHALGVIRILMEGDLDLELNNLLKIAVSSIAPDGIISDRLTSDEAKWGAEPQSSQSNKSINSSASSPRVLSAAYAERRIDPEKTISTLTEFIFERLFHFLRDRGYTAQEVDAVLSLKPQRLSDIPKRLSAVRAFAALPEAGALAAANKRVGNILKKAEDAPRAAADAALFREAAESALFVTLNDIAPKAEATFERGDYATSLKTLAALRQPVDAFFAQVMVNTEDAALRANRLALLEQLRAAMNQVADLSKLSV